MTIGERMKKIRKRLGLTQKEFARRVPGKVDYTYIGKIERGQQYPSIKMLEKIGRAFSLPLSYFFESEDSLSRYLDLLPNEIKDLIVDKEKQELIKVCCELNPRDLSLTMQIINILCQKAPQEALQMAEPKPEYLTLEGKKKKNLISNIEAILRNPPIMLSSEKDWLRQTLKIALQSLKKSLA